MSFPFGHHHHRHGRREEVEEEERRRREAERYHYPSPGHDHPPPAYPPPQQHYPSDHPGPAYSPTPPRYPSADHHSDQAYSSAPQHYPSPGHHPAPAYSQPPPVVQHVHQELDHGSHGGQFSRPSVVHHEGHAVQSSHLGGSSNARTVRIYPKAGQEYSLSVRDGQVILAPSNHSDDYQHWIKDEKYSTKVKDKEGLPSFALINKATGQAIKHSIGETQPVRLIPYNPDSLDESVLWTESKDTGENFRCIRMVNNIRLNFDAFEGDKGHGGVRDGTPVVLWEWLKGDNQRWKIVPY